MLVADIETDGLLPDVSVIHCINVIDRSTGKRLAFNGGVYKDGTPAQRDGTIEEGLQLLEDADCTAFHNGIGYDAPALKKLHRLRLKGRVIDTMVCSRVIWTDLTDRDFNALRKGKLPHDFQKRGLINKHSLEAWGWRLGEYKGDFDPANYPNPGTGEMHTWKTIGFTKEMDEYGRQDVEVTLRLLEKIEEKNYSQECLDLEHAVAEIIFRQHERGFCFSMDEADKLVAKLQRRHAEISSEMGKVFQPWWAPDVKAGTAQFAPKKSRREFVESEDGARDHHRKGVWRRGYYCEYEAGVPYTRIKYVVFNAGSRDHIADRLAKLRGWRPTTFTDNGKPQVDESVLEALPWPEAELLSEYLMVEKRLGQVANGDKAWLNFAVKTGIYGMEGAHYRIHGTINTNGAVTGRMTHANPNVAQTPAVGAPYGEECRSCFIATPGLVLVGCDAEGLELRCLAHFMAIYDGGAYVQVVVNGKKEDGTDVHTVNKNAAGLNLRDSAKTFIYALIYGAQGYKLGTIVYDDFTDEQRLRFNTKYPPNKPKARKGALTRLGESRRDRLMENMPALKQLLDAVQSAVKARGYLKGLDGRLLHIRAAHAALNTLLQSSGAVIMKKALVLFDQGLASSIRSTGGVVEPVANIHDEFQIETEERHAEPVGRGAAECIRRAGEHFKFRCPLAGSYGVGHTWRDTH